MRTLPTPILALAALLLVSPALPAQQNLLLPVDSIERLLTSHPFEIRAQKDTRWEGDRTQRVDIAFADSSTMRVKWAKSAISGQAFNNQPRFELAAYELQKLFLDEPAYVVPPTVARIVPLSRYRSELDREVSPTFTGAASVLVVLQYWLQNVTNAGVHDEIRLAADTVYARHFGDLNILTHIIWHSDSNVGNVLISRDPSSPRVFSVDNGVAFSSETSDRGHAWRTLRTDRLPRGTIERLRALRREDLDRALAVVAEFELRNGELVPKERTAPLNPGQGVRRKGNIVQLGLTRNEISGVWGRIQGLLKRVDSGKVKTF